MVFLLPTGENYPSASEGLYPSLYYSFETPAECVERSVLPKAKISSTTHVQLLQLLQWLHGKQQQQTMFFFVIILK